MFKTSLPYIEKLIKTVVIMTLTTVFFISGLMLCCEIGLLPVKDLKAKITSCCVSAKVKHFKNHHPDNCQCCQLTKDQPDRIQENFELVKHIQQDFLTNEADRGSSLMRQRVVSTLSSQGPPRAPSIPIYLQFSVLRL